MTRLPSIGGEEVEILSERNFQLLLLTAILPPMGLSVMSPVLESLIEPLGTSRSSVGLVMSVFTAPAIVMIPIAGVLADKYGRKPVLTLSLVLFGASGIGMALTTSFQILLAFRFLQGIAFAGVNPITITGIGDLYSGGRETTAQGMRVTGAGLSSTVFPAIAGLVVTIAWQYPFLLYCLALPVAGLFWVGYDEPTNDIQNEGGESERSYSTALWTLIRRPHVMSYVLARGFPVWIWLGFITYNSLIVTRVLGGQAIHAGLLAAAGSLCYAGSAALSGRLAQNFSRAKILAVANGCQIAGFGIILFAPNVVVAVPGTLLLGGGFGILLSLYRSIISQIAPDNLRAGLVSLSEANARVMATLMPVVLGAVIFLAEPRVGETEAIQIAGLVGIAVGGIGGLGTLVIAVLRRPS